jgi:hypothetical protein
MRATLSILSGPAFSSQLFKVLSTSNVLSAKSLMTRKRRSRKCCSNNIETAGFGISAILLSQSGGRRLIIMRWSPCATGAAALRSGAMIVPIGGEQ